MSEDKIIEEEKKDEDIVSEKIEEIAVTEQQETTKKNKKEPKKQAALVRYAVMGGLIVLINLFASYAIRVIYPQPQYNQFCKSEQVQKIVDETECVAGGGQWNQGMKPEEGNVISGYCNQDFTCAKEYEQASNLYQRNVFITFVVLGLLLIVGSLFLSGSTVLASGLSFAGLLALIIGSMSYWSNMDDILRVVILGLALVVLVYLAWKKFED